MKKTIKVLVIGSLVLLLAAGCSKAKNSPTPLTPMNGIDHGNKDGANHEPQSKGGAMPIQSHRTYSLNMLSIMDNVMPGQPVDIRFNIKDEQGNILKDFQVENTKLLHFIIIRKDLQDFQHIHPSFDKSTGEFFITATFPNDGPYRMIADFTPVGAQMGAMGMPLGVNIYQDVNSGTVVSAQSTSSNSGFVATNNLITPQVLGTSIIIHSPQQTTGVVTEAYVDQLVLFDLENIINNGWLSGKLNQTAPTNTGASGPSGVPGPSGQVYAPIGYISPQPQTNITGLTLFSATDLSSTRFVTDHAIVNNSFVVNGSSTFNGSTNFTGATNFSGPTNISGASLALGFTKGSVVFQGDTGLAQDNGNFFYDSLNKRLGVGTNTPTTTFDIHQITNGEISVAR